MTSALPAHTPYDGSAKLFAIGLKQLDPVQWLEVDGLFDAYIAEKRRLYATIPDKVFVAEPGTEAAQSELLALVEADPTAPPVELDEEERHRPALWRASLRVQEDLVLMRRGEPGWRLAAASLCFPSAWTLGEKFGRLMGEIHAPVPGFGSGTRNADLIDRMFDNLRVDRPVERMNWSLQTNSALYNPLSEPERDDRAMARLSRFAGTDPIAAAFIRVERQTLRKLPESGDIVFTIRIHLDPMACLGSHPDRRRIAQGFADELQRLAAAELDYKGFAADRDRLVASLRTIAEAANL